MKPIFLVDKSGNANPFAEQENPVVYKQDFIILNQDKFKASDDLENCKIELFGLKLDSKDIDNAVKDMHIHVCKKQVTSQVGKKLQCPTEQTSNACGKFYRKHVSDFTYSADKNMRQKNVENNMNRTKRAIKPGFDQCKLMPTISRRKQPIINKVSNLETISWKY